ncbi:STE/STE11 protein kinase, variant 1 [Balamuthia mandrillaris]
METSPSFVSPRWNGSVVGPTALPRSGPPPSSTSASASWGLLQVPGLPRKSYGHTSVLASDNLFLFGGCDEKGCFSDSVIIFDLAKERWYEAKTKGQVPQSRHFHAVAVGENCMYIHGGKSNGYHADLFRFDFEKLEWKRIRLKQKTPDPLARYGHSAVNFDGDLYIFGGYDHHGFTCDDIYRMDFKEKKWERVETEGPADSAILANGGGSIGGSGGTGSSGGGKTGSLVLGGSNVGGAAVGGDDEANTIARYHHTGVVYERSMFVFGGKATRGNCSNDLYEFHFDTRSWTLVKTRGKPPSPRWGHSAVVTTDNRNNSVMYIFGGGDGTADFSQLYAYYFAARTWVLMEVSSCPSPRYFHSCSCTSRALYIIGGKNMNDSCFNDVHAYYQRGAGEESPSYCLDSSTDSDRLFPSAQDSDNIFHRVRLKCHFNSEIRMVSVPRDITYSNLMHRLQKEYAEAICLQYKDEEGDIITIRSQEDLEEAFAHYFAKYTSFLENRSNSSSPTSSHTNRFSFKVYIVSSNGLPSPLSSFEGDTALVRPSLSTSAPNSGTALNPFSTAAAQPVKKKKKKKKGSGRAKSKSMKGSKIKRKSGSQIIANRSNKIVNDEEEISVKTKAPSREIEARARGKEEEDEEETPETKSSEPPRKIRWRKGGLLGKGGFGTVYEGMNTDTGELMAVKQVTLPATLQNNHEAKAVLSLQKEIEILSKLKHKNIVRYLGSERVDTSLNIFMELIPGGTIASLLHKFHHFSENMIRSFTRQILLGLNYLHEKGYAHRDIKGANILVSNRGTLHLADFGASKKLKDMVSYGQGCNTVTGTPYYMAPEVIVGKNYGRKADIWSVGAVLVEMATGRPPWAELPPVAALFKIGSPGMVPTIPSTLSNQAKHFLSLCFTRDPKLRPTAAELLEHPFVGKDTIGPMLSSGSNFTFEAEGVNDRESSTTPAGMKRVRQVGAQMRLQIPPASPGEAAGPLSASKDKEKEGEAGERDATYHIRNVAVGLDELGRVHPDGGIEDLSSLSSFELSIIMGQQQRDGEERDGQNFSIEQTRSTQQQDTT